ncbi:MAG: hypothetical protein KBD76_15910 [Bacteriovorax sp.]|nr:hypothetical protein [Alphaproteobacteria bacterium]MBP9682885.1 hypothetical protein [Bacteriovorax sp.]
MTKFPIKLSLLAASIFCFSMSSHSFATQEDDDYRAAKIAVKKWAIDPQYNPKGLNIQRTNIKKTREINDYTGVIIAQKRKVNSIEIETHKPIYCFLESEWDNTRNVDHPLHEHRNNNSLRFEKLYYEITKD